MSDTKTTVLRSGKTFSSTENSNKHERILRVFLRVRGYLVGDCTKDEFGVKICGDHGLRQAISEYSEQRRMRDKEEERLKEALRNFDKGAIDDAIRRLNEVLSRVDCVFSVLEELEAVGFRHFGRGGNRGGRLPCPFSDNFVNHVFATMSLSLAGDFGGYDIGRIDELLGIFDGLRKRRNDKEDILISVLKGDTLENSLSHAWFEMFKRRDSDGYFKYDDLNEFMVTMGGGRGKPGVIWRSLDDEGKRCAVEWRESDLSAALCGVSRSVYDVGIVFETISRLKATPKKFYFRNVRFEKK